MSQIIADAEIKRLLQERKPLPEGYLEKLCPRLRRGHKGCELFVCGSEGGEYRLIIRQSVSNQLDFSVILGYVIPKSNRIFRLCRYNGKSHEHTNRIEGSRFYDFHIHWASERYQERGGKEDSYAEPTTEYGDLYGAVRLMLDRHGFERPDGPQGRLF